MRITLPEIIDRITVLELKIKNSDNSCFKEELAELQEEIKKYEKEGIILEENWINRLREINKELWNLVSELSEAKKNKDSLEEMGKTYIRQHLANKKRVAIKNNIAEKTKSGFRDIKIN